MQQRDRRPGERPGEADVRGPTKGDYSFTDWDNPEDEIEDAPEGYYDEDEPEEGELGPDDPDYDLSEGAGYSGWDSERRTGIPQWVIVAVSLGLIMALLLPALRWFS